MVLANTSLVILCVLAILPTAFSHAYLADPPSRNLVQSWEGSETCPHCLNANGPSNVQRRGRGIWPTARDPISHGLCGDPVQNRNDAPTLADEPYMIPMAPQQVYKAGSIVEFRVAVSTHHYGHYEFRICDEALDGRTLASAADGQACLDSRQLLRAPPLDSCLPGDLRGDCQPVDESNPGRWYLPPPEQGTQQADMLWTSERASKLPAVSEVHAMRFVIPLDLVCDHCTLQWYYATANSCLPDSSYFDYFTRLQHAGWPAAEWAPMAMATWADCSNACCGQQGTGNFGEEFWNCADVRIVSPTASTELNVSLAPNLQKRVCQWHTSAWSPCSARNCNSQGTSTRTVTCHCNDTPSLFSECEAILQRPSQESVCQSTCKEDLVCETRAWYECAANQSVIVDETVSSCCEAPLTCKGYSNIWGQCEPSSGSVSKSVDERVSNLTVTLGVQLLEGIQVCDELIDLAAQVALWAGVDKVIASSTSCEAADPQKRRLPSNGIETVDYFSHELQVAQKADESSLITPISFTRILAGVCPENDMHCDCSWASEDSCTMDDSSLCWCPCCCPFGGVCKEAAGAQITSVHEDTSQAIDTAHCGTLLDMPHEGSGSFDRRDFVDRHGKLKLSGVQLVDQNGEAVQLMGISSHGLHWFSECYTKESLSHLVQQWGINLFRIALYIGEGGYASQPGLLENMKAIVDWCEDLGIYVIIDWHVLTPGDPNYWLTGVGKQQADASKFWHDIANSYKNKPHVLYEICNEPNAVSWPTVKTYADSIIATIREVDSETIIIVGTPTWSQDIHLAHADPVAQPYNVMYAFHFYSGTHRSLLGRVRSFAPLIPIFATEWGTSQASGDGGPFLDAAKEFLDLFGDAQNTGVLISWAQWSFADKEEVSAALKPGSCSRHAWGEVSCSGAFVRNYVQNHLKHNAFESNSTNTSLAASSISSAQSASLAGTINMLVSFPDVLLSEEYGTIGVANGIANISGVSAVKVDVVLSSARRLRSISRRLGEKSMVQAKYRIVTSSTQASSANELAARLTQQSASTWSTVFQIEISKAAARVGTSFEDSVEVISISLPVHHNPAEWHVGSWRECSTTCGRGFQTRSVTCGIGSLDSTQMCDEASRPVATKECVQRGCPTNLGNTTFVARVIFSFVPRSNAHRVVLSNRLSDPEHLKALDDWLFIWLVNKAGGMALTQDGLGKLIKWCEGCSTSKEEEGNKRHKGISIPIFLGTFIPTVLVVLFAIVFRWYRRRSGKYRHEENVVVPELSPPPMTAWDAKNAQRYRTNMPSISVAAHAAVDMKPPHAHWKQEQDKPAVLTTMLDVLPGCCKHKRSQVVAVTDHDIA